MEGSLLGTAPREEEDKEEEGAKVDPLCLLACVGRDIQSGAGEAGAGP